MFLYKLYVAEPAPEMLAFYSAPYRSPICCVLPFYMYVKNSSNVRER